MKKTILFLLCLAVLLCGCAAEPENVETTPPTQTETEPSTEPEQTWPAVAEGRTLTAQQYFVYSCETGEFLTIAEAPDTKIYPASVTKLFTAYVAIQYLGAADSVTAGDAMNMVAAGSSVAGLAKGDTLTVEQLVEGMLLPSGNDAAYVLAVAAGQVIAGKDPVTAQKAVSLFVEEMNAQAKLLGMTGTHFANPDGIHSEDHYTTYADLAILATLALEDPAIMRYANVSSDSVTVASGELQWKNTNALIDPASAYYCPYCTGLKTGQTPYAGSCLLSSFEYRGQTLIIGVFGCPEVDDRFPDTLQLFTDAVKPE